MAARRLSSKTRSGAMAEGDKTINPLLQVAMFQKAFRKIDVNGDSKLKLNEVGKAQSGEWCFHSRRHFSDFLQPETVQSSMWKAVRRMNLWASVGCPMNHQFIPNS